MQDSDLVRLSQRGAGYDPSFNPEGDQVVYCYYPDQSTSELWLVKTDGSERRYLGVGFDPSWSPDGAYIAYTVPGQGLYLMQVDSGQTRLLLDDPGAGNPSWSPDGARLVFFKDDSIWIIGADGTDARQLTDPAQDGKCSWPAVSYDGDEIFYIKGEASGSPDEPRTEPNQIWVMKIDGSDKRLLYAPDDAQMLLFQRPQRADGKILFMRLPLGGASPPAVWIMEGDASDPRALLDSGLAVYGDPVWSPDGTRVALIRGELTTREQDVYVVDYQTP
jgi:Tol biopolymer transport system component